MREHGFVCPRRGKVVNPAEIFRRVVEQNLNVISISFYKVRSVEVREHGYTSLQDFADPLNARFFHNFNVPFDVPQHPQLSGRSQIDFFRAVSITIDRTAALNADEEVDLKTIFNLVIQKKTSYVANSRRGRAFLQYQYIHCGKDYKVLVGMFPLFLRPLHRAVVFCNRFASSNDGASQVPEIRWSFLGHRAVLSCTVLSQGLRP